MPTTYQCRYCTTVETVSPELDSKEGGFSEHGFCLECWDEFLGDCRICKEPCFVPEDHYDDDEQWHEKCLAANAATRSQATLPLVHP